MELDWRVREHKHDGIGVQGSGGMAAKAVVRYAQPHAADYPGRTYQFNDERVSKIELELLLRAMLNVFYFLQFV